MLGGRRLRPSPVWAGGGRHLGCGRSASLSRAVVRGGPNGSSGFGSRAWLVGSPEKGGPFSERSPVVARSRPRRVSASDKRCSDQTGRGKSASACGRRGGGRGPFGAARPLGCGNPAGAKPARERCYSPRGGLPSQSWRGLRDRWSCSWITEIAEVDERHVAPELR
jgi:hypothetical protein